MILCHQLKVDGDGHIVGYTLRQTDPKRHSVLAFKSLQYKVVATGDSFNDISMLRTADAGALFQPSEKVTAAYPDLPVARTYDDLKAMFASHL
jgi:phosphoserine/homoserine phosphotransferase